MKFWEAMREMQENGKSIRCKKWGKEAHAWWSEQGVMIFDVYERLDMFATQEWELYEEPEQLLSFADMVNGLKDGKKFKRKCWGEFYICYCPIGRIIYCQGKGMDMRFSPFGMESFEATDWIEIK